MTKRLFFDAIFKYLLGLILIGLLLFLPAGTFKYTNGWIFMGVLFIPMFIAGIIMMIKNPKLLASRLDVKEKQKNQGIVIKMSGLMFIVGFILAGLDFRFKWLELPSWISYLFSFIFIIFYIMFGEVLRENTYLSRTIRVEEGQKVIDKGLYGIVRHPMYTATIFMFLSMPLILGSLISFSLSLLQLLLLSLQLYPELSGDSSGDEKGCSNVWIGNHD